MVSEIHGRWAKAVELPGLAKLKTGRSAVLAALSCPAPGDCSAGGTYQDLGDNNQAFVASQVNGRWQAAIEVPGTAALNQQSAAAVKAIFCATPGNCSAGGFYTDRNQEGQAFLVSESRGAWGKAIEVPGTGKLNVAGEAEVQAISCGSPGNCEAGVNTTMARLPVTSPTVNRS